MHITKPRLCQDAVQRGLWGLREPDDHTIAAAMRLYRKACTRGKWRRFWASLRSDSLPLKDLNAYKEQRRVYGWRYVGIFDVPLDWIIGSEKLCDAFDRNFFPLKSHNKAQWLTVASAQLMGNQAPPVDLIQIASSYFAQTGQYQISVARAMGLKTIRAYVTRWHVYGQVDSHAYRMHPEHEPVWATEKLHAQKLQRQDQTILSDSAQPRTERYV